MYHYAYYLSQKVFVCVFIDSTCTSKPNNKFIAQVKAHEIICIITIKLSICLLTCVSRRITIIVRAFRT